MAINNYISINDGSNTYKYKTTSRSWKYQPEQPSSMRLRLDGNIDITYGPALVHSWEGEIIAPVATQPAGWGTVATLRTQLAKKVVFQFTDHYGATFTDTAIEGPFREDSIQPDWASNENEILVKIRVTATT